MRYEPVQRLTKEQLLSDLESNNPKVVSDALDSAARFAEDVPWVQNILLRSLESRHLQVRWAAATCLGDLAFRRCQLDLERVLPALELAIQDPEIAEPASLSLSMVRQFLE
jgi:hypothetical protein